MNEASRKTNAGQQVNFTLDPHWRLVLRLAAEADGVSTPDLIRPVIMRYLRRRMSNEDFREAVARIERVKSACHGVPDNITPIPKIAKSRSSRQAPGSQPQQLP